MLYRMNVQAAALETALGEAGVSYQIRGSKRFFDLPEVKQAVMPLRAASVSIVGEPLFKSVSDVLRGRSAGARRRRRRAARCATGGSRSTRSWASSTRPRPAPPSAQFTDELMERQASQHEPTVSAVTLATLHSAKGLEWDNVFLVGLSEGLVPISYAGSFEQIDEERRLLYVGITRARRRLSLSWAATGLQQRSPRERSRFLSEIGIRTARAAGARGACHSPVRASKTSVVAEDRR